MTASAGWSNEHNRLTIIMPYIGKCLSVNHYRYKVGYVKPETRQWQAILAGLAYAGNGAFWRPRITIVGHFKDQRSMPDMSNLTKVIYDALKRTAYHDGLGMDDKWFQDGEHRYGDKSAEPYLEIIIEEGGDHVVAV